MVEALLMAAVDSGDVVAGGVLFVLLCLAALVMFLIQVAFIRRILRINTMVETRKEILEELRKIR